MHISVVIPAYKCSDCLEELYQRLVNSFETMDIKDYEIILVNDGSPDKDWSIIKEISLNDEKVKGINLSRNFGQHKAITAGLDYAKGEWVVVMDGDLQDQPEDIPRLYKKAIEGHNIVFGSRSERKDGYVKKILSKSFNILFNYLVEQKTDYTIANFSIINRKVVNEIIKMREKSRSHALLIYWLGFDFVCVDVDHSKRYIGKSAYSLKKSLNLAIDFAISQSNKPLKIFVKLGVSISMIAFIYGIILIINYLINGVVLQGWTSLMVSLFFIGGLLLASIGVLGVYTGRIFDEVKARPIYAIEDLINIENKE